MVQGVFIAVTRPALPMIHCNLAAGLLPTCGAAVLEALLGGLLEAALQLRLAAALSRLNGTLGTGLAQALAGSGRLCIPQGVPWAELAAAACPRAPLTLLLLLRRRPLLLARLLAGVAAPSSGLLGAAQTCGLQAAPRGAYEGTVGVNPIGRGHLTVAWVGWLVGLACGVGSTPAEGVVPLPRQGPVRHRGLQCECGTCQAAGQALAPKSEAQSTCSSRSTVRAQGTGHLQWPTY